MRLVTAAAAGGLDIEEARARHGDMEELLRRSAPALVPVPGDPSGSVLAVVSARRSRTRLVGIEGRVAAVPTRAVLDLLAEADEQAEQPAAAATVDAAGALAPAARARAVITLVRARLRDHALPPW